MQLHPRYVRHHEVAKDDVEISFDFQKLLGGRSRFDKLNMVFLKDLTNEFAEVPFVVDDQNTQAAFRLLYASVCGRRIYLPIFEYGETHPMIACSRSRSR